MSEMTRESEFIKRSDILVCYEIPLGLDKTTFWVIPTVCNQKRKMSRTRGQTKRKESVEEEEIVVDYDRVGVKKLPSWG